MCEEDVRFPELRLLHYAKPDGYTPFANDYITPKANSQMLFTVVNKL